MIKKVLSVILLALFLGASSQISAETIVIRGGEIQTMTGQILKEGMILIKEGKIVEIGEKIPLPQEAKIIEAEGFILYPGFMAPSFLPASEELVNFESFSPDSLALDRIDFSADYTDYLSGGVTSIYVEMPRNRLISGRGAIVKLGGGDREISIVKKEAALSLNLGKGSILPPLINIFPAPIRTENPIVSSQKQFPSSALGAFWTIHQLFRFSSFSGDLAKYMEAISLSLREAQEQKLPLIISCQRAVEIFEAVELAKILRMPLIIHGGAEAYRVADILKENNVSVLADSFARPNGTYPQEELMAKDEGRAELENIPILIRKGIVLAIRPDEEKYLPDLLWVAEYYQKYGFSETDLLKTITINPARIFGIENRIGSLEKGKDADIVFFQKEKGKPLPELRKVMIEGIMAYEKK